MSRPRLLLAVCLALFFVVGLSVAQYRGRSWGDRRPPEGVRTAREAAGPDSETPNWKIDPRFRRDVFTFARIHYTSEERRWRWRSGGEWWIDTPDSDLNFSFRLQQMTSLNVDPDGRYI
jgi:hypothetical protein